MGQKFEFSEIIINNYNKTKIKLLTELIICSTSIFNRKFLEDRCNILDPYLTPI